MFCIYRVYYDDTVVYVGRTKQKLVDRIRGHLFAKPMHRVLNIEQISRIEYAELPTEADMNLYEIYYILLLHPMLNVDDKARDYPTVKLPELKWEVFTTNLWKKWECAISSMNSEHDKLVRRYKEIPQEIRVVRSLGIIGDITKDEMCIRLESLKDELRGIGKVLFGK